MQINPKLAIWLNIAYAILSGLSIPTLTALGLTANASVILAWAGMGAVVLNAVLHGYSSSIPGPLAPPDPSAVVAAQKVVDLVASKAPVSAIIDAKNQASALINSH